jgi:predicted GIY-YIG superfamily endonuclease
MSRVSILEYKKMDEGAFRLHTVYAIHTDSQDFVYIGYTMYPRLRFYQHMRDIKRGRSKLLFNTGVSDSSIYMELMAVSFSRDEALSYEKKLIARFSKTVTNSFYHPTRMRELVINNIEKKRIKRTSLIQQTL